jgi:hypothetical protein
MCDIQIQRDKFQFIDMAQKFPGGEENGLHTLLFQR